MTTAFEILNDNKILQTIITEDDYISEDKKKIQEESNKKLP